MALVSCLLQGGLLSFHFHSDATKVSYLIANTPQHLQTFSTIGDVLSSSSMKVLCYCIARLVACCLLYGGACGVLCRSHMGLLVVTEASPMTPHGVDLFPPFFLVQEPSGSRTTSENGQADRQAAEAEVDMTEAGDVAEWLGIDSSRKVVAANGHAPAGVSQQHRLSRESSSDRLNKVRLEQTSTCTGGFMTALIGVCSSVWVCACCCVAVCLLQAKSFDDI